MTADNPWAQDVADVLSGRKRWTVITADCLAVLPTIPAGGVDAVVTDPPYGMRLRSGSGGAWGDLRICNDESPVARDQALALLSDLPALVFGRWSVARPAGVRMVLTWEKGNHVGMGDLSLPWKPNTEEIYVIGTGFIGHRGSSVLRHLAIAGFVDRANIGAGRATTDVRNHPTEKPIGLMIELIGKVPGATIIDPFCGSGTTGVACIKEGRRFIGIEIDATYADIARRRIAEAANHLFAGAV